MKKFFLMLMMSLVMVTMTSAQTVHESKMFDNTYVTVSAGIINPTTDIDWFNNVRPQFGVEIGKSLTTLYTTGLEFKTAVNTTGAHTAFDEMSLLWLHKLNLTNMIFYYTPDARWDVNLVGGLGWGHDMCIRDNYGVVQAGVEVAYNLNDTWSILAKPTIEWHHVNDGLNVNHSDLGLTIGVSYKFPNRDGSRGFTVCDGDELYMECNRLNAEINDLRQQLDGQKVINNDLNTKLKLHEQHQCQVDTVIVTKPIGPTIGFTINSAEIDSRHEMNIINIAKEYGDRKIIVKGYADAATGTPEYNMELSGKRAEAVKQMLIKHGVNADNITTSAEGGQINLNPFYTSDYMNRCVLFVIE